MAQDNFIELMRQATEILRDLTTLEANLIYRIAKMDSEARAAIVMAYNTLYKEYKE